MDRKSTWPDSGEASDVLLQCPFCGGEAEIIEIDEGENAGGSCVSCTRCMSSSNVEFGFKENLADNWNRRVSGQQVLVADGSLQAQIGKIGNQIHNIACEHQDDEALADRLGELRGELWRLAKEVASPPQPSVSVADAAAMPRAWLDVLGERVRQIAVEGWTPEHDDQHDRREMAKAAVCYVLWGAGNPNGAAQHHPGMPPVPGWPWNESWWKPTTARRDLVKAGALILAEVERLDRAETGSNG